MQVQVQVQPGDDMRDEQAVLVTSSCPLDANHLLVFPGFSTGIGSSGTICSSDNQMKVGIIVSVVGSTPRWISMSERSEISLASGLVQAGVPESFAAFSALQCLHDVNFARRAPIMTSSQGTVEVRGRLPGGTLTDKLLMLGSEVDQVAQQIDSLLRVGGRTSGKVPARSVAPVLDTVDGESSTEVAQDGAFTEIDDDAEVIAAFFREIGLDESGSISTGELQAVLSKYGEHAEITEVLKVLLGEDEDPNKQINQAQFRKAFETLPRARGERLQWARSLGVEGELARLLRLGDVFDGLKGLKGMSEDERERHIRDVCSKFGQVLPLLLRRGLEKLQSGQAAASHVQQHINTKFCLDGAFVGKFATLDDFFKGPEKLIGTPNPKIMEGMKAEHCFRGNSNTLFTTSNYNVTTWAKQEWEFVVDPKEGVQYPHTPKDKTLWEVGCVWIGDCGRIAEKLEVFKAAPEVKQAGLIESELAGLRLYTGPMFVLYNAVLRGFPDKDVKCLWDSKAGRENRYETTIFVIASGITKLSKITRIPHGRKVYRGLGGMILPKQFWEHFAECQVTIEITAEGDAVEAIINGITGKICVPVKAQASVPRGGRVSDVSVQYLDIGDQATWPRLVNGVKGEGRGVHLSVALPMSKQDFFERHRDGFLQAIGALCNGRHDIVILDVADKPDDFRGGGASMY